MKKNWIRSFWRSLKREILTSLSKRFHCCNLEPSSSALHLGSSRFRPGHLVYSVIWRVVQKSSAVAQSQSHLTLMAQGQLNPGHHHDHHLSPGCRIVVFFQLAVLLHAVQGAELREYLDTSLSISSFLTLLLQLGQSYKSNSCYCDLMVLAKPLGSQRT